MESIWLSLAGLHVYGLELLELPFGALPSSTLQYSWESRNISKETADGKSETKVQVLVFFWGPLKYLSFIFIRIDSFREWNSRLYAYSTVDVDRALKQKHAHTTCHVPSLRSGVPKLSLHFRGQLDEWSRQRRTFQIWLLAFKMGQNSIVRGKTRKRWWPHLQLVQRIDGALWRFQRWRPLQSTFKIFFQARCLDNHPT